MMSLLRCILALVALSGASVAQAHTLSESHSAWRVDGRSVRLIFTAPELEAKRLAAPGAETAGDEEIISYLTPRLSVSSGGQACAASREGHALSAAANYRRFEFLFACADADAIEVHSGAFFDLVPTHVNFAQIETSDGGFAEAIMTADRQTISASGDADAGEAPGGVLDFIWLGIKHIWTGQDHQAFLLGLVLISRRLRDLVFVVTGFTLGHSLTLALAVTGVFRPHAEFIDALIGLTIALVAAENVVQASGRAVAVAAATGVMALAMAAATWLGFGGLPLPLTLGAGLFGVNYLMISSRLADAARFRLVVTLAFGCIHGFGFAADLLEMKLPVDRLISMLVGFNVGVEIGQLALVFFAIAVVWALMRLRLAPPRDWVVDICSAVLAGLGLFWFVSRAYAG